MLERSEVHVNVPAADLKRARAFYTDKLGLTPVAEDDYSIRFATPAGSWFQVYETSYAGTGKHTVAQWDVADLATTVAELHDAGVGFEHYDMPGVTWDGDIANAGGMRMAWFTDSEGNVMCLDERPPG
ncbi:MAG: Glyoxalase/bleomycin resistance protein/dioxygenase [Friedmanniella sp.]|nr:Glyoxalase/bleomycin resistance protein/dioxygenase [Friedmanniella sp.]